MKDPKIEFRKTIYISILILSIGIAQLVIIIAGRSWLIWSKPETHSLSGEAEITVPPSYLLPNRYIVTVIFHIPNLWTDDLVGNITFMHQKTGKSYTYDYKLSGYMSYKLVESDAVSYHLPPGIYNISWINNLDDYEYTLTTHGLINLFPKDDLYPYLIETIGLIISIFVCIAFTIGAIKKYLKGKREYAYYK